MLTPLVISYDTFSAKKKKPKIGFALNHSLTIQVWEILDAPLIHTKSRWQLKRQHLEGLH